MIRPVAHFNVTPKRGKILPRKDRDVQIAFVPNQIGQCNPQANALKRSLRERGKKVTMEVEKKIYKLSYVFVDAGSFTPQLLIDVMGPVIDVSSLILQQKPFHEGISPKISVSCVELGPRSMGSSVIASLFFHECENQPADIILIFLPRSKSRSSPTCCS